jgi:replicative DNA helicase
MAYSQSTEPLHDREAEQAVLGAMMLEEAVIPRVIAQLGHTPEAFLTTDHQLIYAATLSCYDRLGQVDAVLVATELEKADQLKRAGGPGYLYDLQAQIVETENTEFYAEIIREKWIRRQLISISGNLNQLARDQEKKLDDVLNEAQEGLFQLSHNQTQQGFVQLAPIVKESLTGIEQLYRNEQRYVGIPTGFTDFDVLTSGLQRKDLIIIAARPSMGKTTLALNIAQHIAIDQQLPVAIFSLEMPSQQVVMRMLAAEAQIDFGQLRTGNFQEDDWEPLTEGAERLMAAPIYISDVRGVGVQTLRAEGRRLKGEREDLSAIIVDYLQLLRGDGAYTGRVEEISEISRALKTLAWELDTPVVACSQLNREVERRPDKRPQLSDLRESGAIEQDADVIAFLYREDYYDEQADDQGLADLIIRKQRNGPTGTIRLQFFREQMRFDNIYV